jgi:hypothetical protein
MNGGRLLDLDADLAGRVADPAARRDAAPPADVSGAVAGAIVMMEVDEGRAGAEAD